ncbi:hypothetical protein ACQ4M3_07610 [Leptolyngbya sp. AN03gr2]|uniref:hypothetical protein n=1 Tax=unclassified Leptolyngbya TaxID=2650499 RepID=UPI003D323897
MKHFLLGWGQASALSMLFLLGIPSFADAQQQRKVGNIKITFHVEPDDQASVNQPTQVWVQIDQNNRLVKLSQCSKCRLELLAPDGQLLNRFDSPKLFPLNIPTHPSAFGTRMTFGAPGDFRVAFIGTIRGKAVRQVFEVPVR